MTEHKSWLFISDVTDDSGCDTQYEMLLADPQHPIQIHIYYLTSITAKEVEALMQELWTTTDRNKYILNKNHPIPFIRCICRRKIQESPNNIK